MSAGYLQSWHYHAGQWVWRIYPAGMMRPVSRRFRARVISVTRAKVQIRLYTPTRPEGLVCWVQPWLILPCLDRGGEKEGRHCV